MKNNIFLLFFLLFSLTAQAQKVSVVSNSTLRPVEDVAIFNTNKNFSILTGADGNAEITGLAPEDTLTFQHPAYYVEYITLSQLAKTNYKVFLIDKVIFLEEFVVAVSKSRERAEEVANRVEVIHPREIEFSNPQNTAEMLEQTGNVFVQKSQMGGGSPVIRGFEANKVLIVVDGVRMNNAIYRSGHLHNVITIDNNILERAEVVFGPGSLIYGSDALGGVMHFYTRKPILSTDGEPVIRLNAFTRYATANHEKTGHINFNLGFKNFGSLTSVTVSDYDDLRSGNVSNPFYPEWGKRYFYQDRVDNKDTILPNTNPNIQIGTGYRQTDLLQKFLFKPNEKLDFIVNLQGSLSSDIPRYDQLSNWSNRQRTETIEVPGQDTVITIDTVINYREPTFAEWSYGPQSRFLGSLTTTYSSTTPFFDKFTVILAYQKVNEERITREFGSAIRNSRFEDVDVFTINADFGRELKNGQELHYGLESTFNDVGSTAMAENILTGEITGASTRYPDGGSSMTTHAGYIKYSIRPTPSIRVTQGLRYSSIKLNSKFDDTSFFEFNFDEINLKTSALSGTFGLIFNPDKRWNASLMFASGFRSPNVDDMGKVFSPSPGIVVVPNANLKPEYAYNTEASITRRIEDRLKIGVVAYNTVLKNAIVRDKHHLNVADSLVYDGTLSEVYSNVNIGTAVIRGFSVNMAADITTALSLESDISYTFGLDQHNNAPLAHIPPVFGKTGFKYQKEKFRGEFFIHYNGWKRIDEYSPTGEDNLEHATEFGTPAWYTLNLRTSYQLNRYLRVQASVENILDRHYRNFASGISAPGRNLIVALRASF